MIRAVQGTIATRRQVSSLRRDRTSDINLFARFKALQRIDAIDGIIPEIERLKVKRRHEETQPVPMFVLPEGARISVTVNQAALAPPQDNQGQTEVIDVTLEQKKESSESDYTPQKLSTICRNV